MEGVDRAIKNNFKILKTKVSKNFLDTLYMKFFSAKILLPFRGFYEEYTTAEIK